MKHTLEIPNWYPTSDNKLGGHWTTRRRYKAADAQMIAVYAHKQNIPKATGKRKLEVIVTIHIGGAPDPANLNKSLHDALKNAKLIIDDKQEYLEAKQTVIKRGKAKHTTIILEDL